MDEAICKAEEDKSITGGQTWNERKMLHARHFYAFLVPPRKETAMNNFCFASLLSTDRGRVGSLAGATRRGPRKGLFKPSHRQSPGASRSKSTYELHELFGVGSGSQLGCEPVTARSAVRRNGRRPRDAVRSQASSSFNVLAIFIIMDCHRVREIG